MADNWVSTSDLLSRLEDLEMPLLAWGIVDRALSRVDVERVIGEQILEDLEAGHEDVPTVEDYLDHLVDAGLLHPVPGSVPETYRTRIAEYLRLLRKLRQLFPPRDATVPAWWRNSPSLVSDYRIRVASRFYPQRSMPASEVVTALQTGNSHWTAEREAILGAVLGGRTAARFQTGASQAILQALESGNEGAFIVTAGTGSGKTLAFYLPVFLDLRPALDGAPKTVHTLALYPRNELLRDQARECLRTSLRIWRDPASKGSRPVRIGVLYGNTPQSGNALISQDGSKFITWTKSGDEYVCPYFPCPEDGCEGDLVWRPSSPASMQETLRCTKCGTETPPKAIALTRDSMVAEPPDILFTSTEMLSQRSTDRRLGQLLGWMGPVRPRLVLLDEAHTYSGVHGAQVALTLRRWRHATNRVGPRPIFVGLSATLKNPEAFFSRLTGIDESLVEGIAPTPDEMVPIGREYGLVVRGDPVSGASLLSTTIQTAMLSARVMDLEPGLFGSSVFLFTDDLDVTNRMFDDLRDAEGSPGWRGRNRSRAPLAEIRSPSEPQERRRYADGQNWELPHQIGRLGTPLRVGRTSSQDSGVDANADVIVATGSLEVGFNDPRVGLVIQHKAPHDSASFIQRRGRAGRSLSMRPITVVVLSDYGRDNTAYRTYEQLLDPDVDSRNIPVGNRYVLKIQGASALLDWVAEQTGANVRAVLVKEPRATRDAATRVTGLLARLLEDGTLQNRLAMHLRRSLAVSDNDALAIMWDEPRSLMLSVVPTALRRLETNWSVASNEDPDPGAESKSPLPEFITASLFEPLNIPGVELVFPSFFNQDPERVEILKALREAVPGRVSHRFGYARQNRRTWLPLPDNGLLDLTDIVASGQRQGDWTGLTGRQYFVVRPLRLRLQEPPADILDSSNALPKWDSEFIFPASLPVEMDVPSPSTWERWIDTVEFFTHATGSQLTIRRMTPGAVGELARQSRSTQRSLQEVDYVFEGEPAALGFDGSHDAMAIHASLHADWQATLGRVASSPPLRTLAFKQRVLEDSRLDGLANSFQRSWLADLFLHAYVVAGQASRDPQVAVAALTNGSWLAGMGEYMHVVYRGDDPQTGGGSRLENTLRDIANDPIAQAVVEEHAAILVKTDLYDDTQDLLRRAVSDTLAHAVSSAASELLADSGDADLIADILWSADSDQFRIILSESSIGGLGLIEQLMTRYARNPRAFWEKVEAVVGPSEYENVDQMLRAALAHVTTPGDPLALATDRLRSTEYAEQSHEALDALLDTWTRLLGPPTHLEVSTFATRLLKPGSSHETTELLVDLLNEWDRLETDLGVEVDARSLAYLAAQGDLRWSKGQITADTVESLLWLRGTRARAQRLQAWNPYRSNEIVERLVLDTMVSTETPRVDVTQEGWIDEYRTQLQQHGEIVLEAPLTAREAMATAVRVCTALPVERGPLRVYGRVLGCSQRLGQTLTRVAITEEYQ